MATGSESQRTLIHRVLVISAIVALLVLLWKIQLAILLAFGSVLLAILFSKTAAQLSARTGLSRRWSLGAVLLVLTLLFAAFAVLLGHQVIAQFGELSGRIADIVPKLPADLADTFDRDWLVPVTRWAARIIEVLGYVLLMVFGALYLALSPATYENGLVLLLPPARHARAREVLGAAGEALWKWMLGTMLSMVLVGCLTTAGLVVLALPSAVALGVIAATLEFIPILGPWLAAVPAILVAFAAGGWDLVLKVALLYVIIQQVEGNVIYPLVQKKAVLLPPALTLYSILVFGLLLGLPGMVLAAPLLVVVLVVINLLYVEDALGERPRFP